MLSPKPCSSPLIVSSFPLNRFVFAGGMHNDLNLIQYSNYCNLPHLIAEAILIKECVPLCHLMVLFRIHQSSALLQCFNLQGKHCGQSLVFSHKILSGPLCFTECSCDRQPRSGQSLVFSHRILTGPLCFTKCSCDSQPRSGQSLVFSHRILIGPLCFTERLCDRHPRTGQWLVFSHRILIGPFSFTEHSCDRQPSTFCVRKSE